MSHTPGPWHLLGDDGVVAANDVAIVNPFNGDDATGVGGNTEAEADANARLIAAAPELLDALKNIEMHHVAINRKVGRGQEFSATLRIARAAIAKATGGAQ